MSSRPGVMVAEVVKCLFVIGISALCLVRCEGACKNALSNCSNYNSNVCHAFPTWSRKNCANTCGLCGECPQGWNPYPDDQTCLKVFGFAFSYPPRNLKSWSDSRKTCHDMRGDLVMIHDDKKNQFVSEHFGTQSFIWIGVRRDTAWSNYKYSNGTDLDYSQPPWFKDRSISGNCVIMLSKGNYTGQWLASKCSNALPFVCQISVSALAAETIRKD